MLAIAVIRAAQPLEKPYKLFDGGGLYLPPESQRLPFVALEVSSC